MDDFKTERLHLRVSPADKHLLTAAARTARCSVAALLLRAGLERARELVSHADAPVLAPEVRRAVLAAIAGSVPDDAHDGSEPAGDPVSDIVADYADTWR